MPNYTKSYYILAPRERVQKFTGTFMDAKGKFQSYERIYVGLKVKNKKGEIKEIWTAASLVSEDGTKVLVKLNDFNIADWTIVE